VAASGPAADAPALVFFTASKSLKDEFPVEAVMLAGTDRTSTFNDREIGLPTPDCAEIHAAASASVATRQLLQVSSRQIIQCKFRII
jgi:hypothetical protein